LIKYVRYTALAIFIAGGLLSGTLGLNNLAFLAEQPDSPAPPLDRAATPADQAAMPVGVPTAAPALPVIAGLHLLIAPSPTQEPPDPNGTAWLYVIGGNLWESDGRSAVQLTNDGHIGQPTLSADALLFVEQSRNASDVWLASPDAPPRPITRNTSPTVSKNHWASQPIFVPGRQRLFVLGDFNKSSTGPGDLAVWELGLGQEPPVQITRPPAYAGGDQDVTADPDDPRQIIFTRYAYVGTQLIEQLEWLDVSSDTLVPLTATDQPSRQASYSPDAKHIAFVRRGPAMEEDLYMADVQVANGRAQLDNARQLVSGVIANPVWSPDGSTLAYLAEVADGFQLWSTAFRRDADGTESPGLPRQITTGSGVDATSRPVYLTGNQAKQVQQWLSSPVK